MQLEFPKNFLDTVSNTHGENGKRWIKDIPDILEGCKDLWKIQIAPSKFDLSYNYVTTAQREDGSKVVLKIGYPQDREFQTEMEALDYFSGRNIVRLLEKNAELGAMLLENLSPGTTLKNVQKQNDEEATLIAAPLIRDLPIQVPKQHTLLTLKEWASVIQRVKAMKTEGPITSDMLDKAQHLFEYLEETKQEDKLLHGDLHHDNILYDEEKGWIAIDPKGLIADPAFHGARFIQNFWDTTPTLSLIKKRIEIIASITGFEERRIAQWAYVDYIISNTWTVEENRIPDISAIFIEALESVIG